MVVAPTAPGGMPDYRLSLALSFFYKFYLFVSEQCNPGSLSLTELSATEVSDCFLSVSVDNSALSL